MIIEYLNNLTGFKFRYKGSGTINVFGGAQTDVVFGYGIMDVWFQDNEWVYTTDHNIRQVKAANNSPDSIVWTTYGEGFYQADFTPQLLKFEQGPAFFTAKYTAIVNYYEGLLNQVNAKLSRMPLTSMSPEIYEKKPKGTKNASAAVKASFAQPTKKESNVKEMDMDTLAECLDTIRNNIKKLGKNAKLHR